MKKCARCDFEYEDAYDGCPNCARQVVTPTATTPGRPLWPWIVAGIVILSIVGVVALTSLGLFASVGSVAFSAASAEAQKKSCFANQRTIMGAEALAVQQGATLPLANWDELMSVLVPDYLKMAPTCPTGGTYTFTQVGGVVCSTHGSVNNATSTP